MFRVPLLPRQLQTNMPINGSVRGDLSDGGGGGGGATKIFQYIHYKMNSFSVVFRRRIKFVLFYVVER